MQDLITEIVELQTNALDAEIDNTNDNPLDIPSLIEKTKNLICFSY